MVDVDRLKESIRVALSKLSQGHGVQRINLKAALSDDLIRLWQIRPDHGDDHVRKIVAWQLEQLIKRHLSTAENEQIAARYSFNITGKPEVERERNLGERQRMPSLLLQKEGVSARSIQDDMRNILDVFAKSLVIDPPDPMPEPEQPAEPKTPAAPPKTEPVAAVQQEPQPVPPAEQPKVDEQAAKLQKRKKVLIGSGIAGALALIAVIAIPLSLSGEDNPNPGNTAKTGNSQIQTTTTGDTSATTAEGEGVPMVFDDLDGGEPIIQVYPGVSESKADKLYNGTFRDGQTVYAICKTKGRTVRSHPELGERDVPPSDDWIRFHAVAGIGPYATAIYVGNPAELLAQLPDC